MTDGRIGVVVMAYGTPASPEDVEPYYTHIRRGRPPSPEQLADLQRRYDALGGTSTLARRTADQVDAIARALEAHHPGRFLVALGQKHAEPFIEDGVAALAGAGRPRPSSWPTCGAATTPSAARPPSPPAPPTRWLA